MKNWFLRITLILVGSFPFLFYQNCSKPQRQTTQAVCGLAQRLPNRTVFTYFTNSHGKLRYFSDGQLIYDDCLNEDQNPYAVNEDHRPTNLSLIAYSENFVNPETTVHYQIYDQGPNCGGIIAPTKFYDATIHVETVTEEISEECLGTYGVDNQVFSLHEAPVNL